jgi:hypothetical protein
MMTAEEKRIATISLQLSEWRRKDDSIGVSFQSIRSRSIAVLGVEIGLAGYFISKLDTIIKPELYGILFFSLAAILAVAAVLLVGWNYLSKRHWSSPMYDVEIEKMNNADKLSDAYIILTDDYKKSYDHNMHVTESAAKRLNGSLLLFIASAIMLMILTFA